MEEDKRVTNIRYFKEKIHKMDKWFMGVQRGEEETDWSPGTSPGRTATTLYELSRLLEILCLTRSLAVVQPSSLHRSVTNTV
jgi:hypothetical protein